MAKRKKIRRFRVLIEIEEITPDSLDVRHQEPAPLHTRQWWSTPMQKREARIAKMRAKAKARNNKRDGNRAE